MKRSLLFLCMVLLVQHTFSQTIVVNHHTSTSSSTFSGCDFDYYYNGWPATTANNQNKTINFQAPIGSCISVTFFRLSLEICCDFLRITDGLNNTGSVLSSSASSGYYKSTTGVLSFTFTSDASFGGSGWYAKINCTCPSYSDAISQDCFTALPLCSSVGGTPSSINGSVNDLNSSNRGCLSTGEKYGAWYEVVIQSSGTFQFAIDPATNHDYDFAVWGPNKSCSSLGAPIRCSYSPPTGALTGINSVNDNWVSGTGGSGTSEDNTTYNDWTTEINALAGQRYYVFVGDYTSTAPISGFTLTLAGTATFSCNLALSVELFEFYVLESRNENVIYWSTSSEKDNAVFFIEKSDNGTEWQNIGMIKGNGTTNQIINYQFTDNNFDKIVNYYRLIQVDFDGKSKVYESISVDNRIINKKIVRRLNLLGEDVDDSFKGFIIIEFDDGTTQKVIK